MYLKLLFSKRRLFEGPNGLYYQNDGLRYKCIVLCHYCIIYQCLSSIATPYGPPLISKHDFPQESLLCSLLEIHPYVCKRLKIRMCVIYKSISLFLYSTLPLYFYITQKIYIYIQFILILLNKCVRSAHTMRLYANL